MCTCRKLVYFPFILYVDRHNKGNDSRDLSNVFHLHNDCKIGAAMECPRPELFDKQQGLPNGESSTRWSTVQYIL